MPEEHKNTEYWMKRRKNNEAARRSREKRKMNDVLLERRVMVLTEENKQLRAQLLAIKMKYGEYNDICSSLTTTSTHSSDSYEKNYDSVCSDAGLLITPDTSTYIPQQMKEMQSSVTSPRHFTSKVFTNASGDTSATVHVNKLSGPSVPSSKLDFTDFVRPGESDLNDYLENDRISVPQFRFSNPTSSKSGPAIENESLNNVRNRLLGHSVPKPNGKPNFPNDKDDETNDSEKAAFVMTGKFNFDILKSLSFNKQAVFPNTSALSKISFLQDATNAIYVKQTSDDSAPRRNGESALLRTLQEIDKYKESIFSQQENGSVSLPETFHPSVTGNAENAVQRSLNSLSMFSEICCKLGEENARKEEAKNSASLKRKYSDDINETQSDNGISESQILVCDDAEAQAHPSAPKTSVQLPHKLRLKKCAKFTKAQT